MNFLRKTWRQIWFLISQSVDGPPPHFLEFRSSKWFIMIAMFIAIFTDLFLYSVIVPVFPFALETKVGIAPERTQYWVSVLLAVYGAALFVGAPICGVFADYTTSRRGPFLLGLVLLAGATGMLAAGSSIGILIAGRILQGLSAAMVWVVGLALLVDTVGKEGIAEASGYLSIAISLAFLLAPLLGGVVYAKAGYYAVYGMCFGLLGIDIVLRLALVEQKVARHWLPRKTEQPETSESSEEPSNQGRLSDREQPDVEKVNNGLDKAQPNIAQAEAVHQPGDAPVSAQTSTTGRKRGFSLKMPVQLYLLGNARMLVALYGTMIQALLLTSFDSVIPLYVREIFHWDSIGAGLIFLPLVIASFISPVVGYITDKRGPRLFAVAGFLFCCPFYILLRLVDHDGIRQKVLLCALLFLIGLGLMMTLPPIMAEITYATLEMEARKPAGFFGAQGAFARAYALFNMAYAAGTLIGPIWGGMIREAAGWGTMTWTLGLLSATTCIPMVIWCGGLLWGSRKSREGVRQSGEHDKIDEDEEKAEQRQAHVRQGDVNIDSMGRASHDTNR